jgi:hypothetical protein
MAELWLDGLTPTRNKTRRARICSRCRSTLSLEPIQLIFILGGCMYETIFTVKGRGPFPKDMLKYGECFPHSDIDTEAIFDQQYAGHRPREIMLRAYHTTNLYSILFKEWRKHHWGVIHITTQQRDSLADHVPLLPYENNLSKRR